MEKKCIIVDQDYMGLGVGVPHYVFGKVIKKLENTVIFSVERFNYKDLSVVTGKLHTVMVRYQDISEIEQKSEAYWPQVSVEEIFQ